MLSRFLTALLLVVATAGDASARDPRTGVQPEHLYGTLDDRTEAATPAPVAAIAPPARALATGGGSGTDAELRTPLRSAPLAFRRPDQHPAAHRPNATVLTRHLPYARTLARAHAGGHATLCQPPPPSAS